MKERFKETVRAIEKHTSVMEIGSDGKLNEVRKLGQGSRLDEDGWNSDKEKALFSGRSSTKMSLVLITTV